MVVDDQELQQVGGRQRPAPAQPMALAEDAREPLEHVRVALQGDADGGMVAHGEAPEEGSPSP
eukprot:12314181-Alexandrium_andersonii.AAC.1